MASKGDSEVPGRRVPRRFSLCVACGFVGPVPPQVPLERLLKGGPTLYGYTKHRTVTVPVRGIVVGGELWPDPIGRPVIRFRRALLRHMSRANVPPPTLPALPPDLTRLVLSFLDDVRSIARVRCVSRTLRAIAGSDEVWKRFVPATASLHADGAYPATPSSHAFGASRCFAANAPITRWRPTHLMALFHFPSHRSYAAIMKALRNNGA